MKVGYLIVGRLKSTRLPKKVMLEVKGKPFLGHMVDRLKLSKRSDVIVLCTSTHPEDDPLEKLAGELGIECFRGDEDDVIKRLYDASVKYSLDYILTITADCPLVDPVYADKVVEAFEREGADWTSCMGLPHGAFTHGLNPKALKKILEIKDSTDTEVWPRYFTDTGLFKTYEMPIVNPRHNRPDIRMTLDYPEDLEFFKSVINALYHEGKVFTLDEIIDYLEKRPEVMDLNRHCAGLYKARHTKQSEIKLKQRAVIKKVVVFGAGSIGQRHMRNLKAIGINDVAVFRTRLGHYQDLPADIQAQEISSWQDVASFKPDAAIIANPTSLHVPTALQLLAHVRGVFIEKPLSHTLEHVQELADQSALKNVVSFVGYNLLFHPVVKAIKEEMDKGVLGKPLVLQCQAGQWLPDWHPYEDYKQAYYARKDLGGGVLLTLIHEVNLARYLLGPAKNVSAVFPTHDKLKLGVEMVADLMVSHINQSVSQIHLDYIQKPASRCGTIVCEYGLIRYDLTHPSVSVQSEQGQPAKVVWADETYDIDEMYKEELRLFLRYSAEGRMKHEFDFNKAIEDLRIVEAAFAGSAHKQLLAV